MCVYGWDIKMEWLGFKLQIQMWHMSLRGNIVYDPLEFFMVMRV